MTRPSGEKAARQSNFELLRIFAMFLIVSFHLTFKSGFDFSAPTPDALFLKSCWLFGELGVNLFMLVTGYFLVFSQTLKSKKVVLLLAQVLFYYVVTYFVALWLRGDGLPEGPELFVQFFPTMMNRYWYATAYVIIFLLSPWINRLQGALDQRQHLSLLCVLLVLYSVIPTFFGVFGAGTEGLMHYTRLLWLTIIYLVGGYLRRFGLRLIGTLRRSLTLALFSFGLMVASVAAIAYNAEFMAYLGTGEWAYLRTPNNLLMFLCSLGFFGVFSALTIPANRLVNAVASTTFGIYLIHDGPLQGFIWQELVGAAAHQTAAFMPLFVLGSAAAVFCACAVIDYGRQWVEKRTLTRFLDSKAWERITGGCTRAWNRFADRAAS